MQKKRKKIIILVSCGAALVVLMFLAYSWVDSKMRKAEAIQKAIANPEYIDPEKLLNEIDSSFRGLSDPEKKKLLQDPAATEKQIAEATCKELGKSFKLLFMLPSSIREKVIRESADDLRRKALEDPDKVSDFFDSSAGNGALRGASRFFLLELSGRQKAESAPLTQAMYEIVKDQARRKVQK
ncbi:MAG TPA: hypothetical protein DET40_01335 [Lentisphaeria bacterium]|nr:MAG: hypothetical protein A2X45_09415 [Lentisphaerae bacterium GWF2_50_93]HCE42175.1 hypothetical protein [Lentisphaeria bacterium]